MHICTVQFSSILPYKTAPSLFGVWGSAGNSAFQVLTQILRLRLELWMGHSRTSTLFTSNHLCAALAWCFESLSCLEKNKTNFYLYKLFQGLLPRIIPTAWYCHHYASQWEMCFCVDVQCLMSTKKGILSYGQSTPF